MDRHAHMNTCVARGKAFSLTGVGKIRLVAAILLSLRVSGEELPSIKEKDADTIGTRPNRRGAELEKCKLFKGCH